MAYLDEYEQEEMYLAEQFFDYDHDDKLVLSSKFMVVYPRPPQSHANLPKDIREVYEFRIMQAYLKAFAEHPNRVTFNRIWNCSTLNFTAKPKIRTEEVVDAIVAKGGLITKKVCLAGFYHTIYLPGDRLGDFQ